MVKQYINWPKNRPNGNKMYQLLLFQDPAKFSQIGIENIPSGNPD
jgi:hypothetical protein